MKEIVDKHEKDIEELKNKLAAAMAMGGGGDGVDLDEMSKLFAGKNPPDNTIVRIEELEKLNAEMMAKLINHDKTLYQNNTLEDLKKDASKQ